MERFVVFNGSPPFIAALHDPDHQEELNKPRHAMMLYLDMCVHVYSRTIPRGSKGLKQTPPERTHLAKGLKGQNAFENALSFPKA